MYEHGRIGLCLEGKTMNTYDRLFELMLEKRLGEGSRSYRKLAAKMATRELALTRPERPGGTSVAARSRYRATVASIGQKIASTDERNPAEPDASRASGRAPSAGMAHLERFEKKAREKQARKARDPLTT